MSKHELLEFIGISSSLAKLKGGANITTDVHCKICEALNCDFKDMMEYLPKKDLPFRQINLPYHIKQDLHFLFVDISQESSFL